MPELMKESEVSDWFKKIRLSQAWKKPYEDTWNRIIDYLKTKYFDKLSDEDKICVNMVHPHVRVVIPAIYSRNPDILVTPRRFNEYQEDTKIRKRAEVMQNLLRYLLKELDLKTETKLCILDAILTGHAWAKTGYETKFEKVEEEPKTLVSELLETIGIKKQSEEDEFQISEKIVSERLWALRSSVYDMFVPALSRRKEELLWLVERMILPYEIVMDNDDYDTTGLKESANANQLLASLRGAKYKSIPDFDDLKYSIIYEVYDGMTQQVITLAEGHKKALQKKDFEYDFLDSRFHTHVMLRFNEITDEFYPQSDIEPAEPQLLELNEIRTDMVKHRKRYNRKYYSKPGAFDAQAKADLKEGEDGVIIETTQTYVDSPLADIIQPITDAQMPAEIYTVETRIKDDLFTILGTSDYASQASGGANTATEASIIATQSRFRVEERIDAVGQFVNQIVRNLAQMAQRFMDSEQVGNVVGLDGQIYWVQVYDKRELQGEFSYDIVYGSTAPINRDVDREQFMKFYVLAKDDPYYNQVKLRLQLARKFDLENPESWLVDAIVKELETQRLIAAKRGMLLTLPNSPAGGPGPPGRVPRQGGGERLPTGQPRGLPGDLGGEPRMPQVPGGTGGTNLA